MYKQKVKKGGNSVPRAPVYQKWENLANEHLIYNVFKFRGFKLNKIYSRDL